MTRHRQRAAQRAIDEAWRPGLQRLVVTLMLFASVLLATSHVAAIGGNHQCDFNGDGYDDAAIGVAGDTVAGVDLAGSVNVIYGSARRLTASGNQLWNEDVLGAGESIERADRFGNTVECGDFNGDGYADLAIGAPGSHAAAIRVLYGGPEGLTDVNSQLLHPEAPARFGATLAAGDFDNDGRDDLAVGAPGEQIDRFRWAGSVHVFHGSEDGLSTQADQKWSRASKGIKGFLFSDYHFGAALATGDFDGNGYDDLAIGVPEDVVSDRKGIGQPRAGSVNVIYGSSNGLTAFGDDLFDRSIPGIKRQAGKDDHFGSALASGDFDGDGYDDLAIGVPFDHVRGVRDAGSIHILRGGPNGLKKAGDKIWHRDSPHMDHAIGEQDYFGSSLTSGDYNGDGHADLAIGVYAHDVGGPSAAGSVHVMYGSDTGVSGIGDQIWHQGSHGIKGRNEGQDFFGFSLSSGDFNNNGKSDLIVAVPGEDSIDTEGIGKVVVIYGLSDGLTARGDQRWDQDSPGIEGTAGLFEQFGRNVSGTSP